MTEMSKLEVEAIDEAIRLLIEDIAPDARYAPKYGGDVILPDPDSNDFIGGIFAYTEHVSLEFSHGASFRDPDGHLEGKGKGRRHLKFREHGDVEAKNTRIFLEQAFGK